MKNFKIAEAIKKDFFMMSDFEFIDYVATPGEKHLGIARVKAWNKITLRYKISAKKDGPGYYIQVAVCKLPSIDGTDNYAPLFTLESMSDKEDCENLVRAKVAKLIVPPTSVFQPAQHQQAPQQQQYNQYQYQQQPVQYASPPNYLQQQQYQPAQPPQYQQSELVPPNGLPF